MKSYLESRGQLYICYNEVGQNMVILKPIPFIHTKMEKFGKSEQKLCK